MDLRALLSGDRRSDTTVTQYIAILKRLQRMVTGAEDLKDIEWLQDLESVMGAIEHYKPGSRKLYIVPVVVLLKGCNENDLHAKYSNELEKCTKDIASKDNMEQTKTERELKNWITLKDVKDKINKLQRTIRRKIMVKKIDQIDVEDRRIITHHLILNLYSKMNPLRNDYAEVKIIPHGHEQSQADQKLNVLVEAPPGSYTMYLRHYKTHKAYGDKTAVFPKSVNKIVSDSLRLFPRSYLLSNLTNGEQPMSPAYLSKTFGQIFEKDGKHVGSWMLRKIFLSELYKDEVTLKERHAIAASMGHSAEIAERVYRRV
jgi:hypothetical protein